jgi:hypothetical protein
VYSKFSLLEFNFLLLESFLIKILASPVQRDELKEVGCKTFHTVVTQVCGDWLDCLIRIFENPFKHKMSWSSLDPEARLSERTYHLESVLALQSGLFQLGLSVEF